MYEKNHTPIIPNGLPQVVLENLPANEGDTGDKSFDPSVGKSPWKRKQQLTPVFLPGESQDRGAWQAMVHRVTKSQA